MNVFQKSIMFTVETTEALLLQGKGLTFDGQGKHESQIDSIWLKQYPSLIKIDPYSLREPIFQQSFKKKKLILI